MSELSPALISIAGGNEFLFARFYHIYEGVQLVLPESPPIVSGVSDMPRRIVQTWKRHGIRCKHSVGRNAHIFLQKMVQSVAVRLYSGSDPMQLLLIFFLTNRKTERIVDIDDHVHADCRNHTCHNVEDGVLF